MKFSLRLAVIIALLLLASVLSTAAQQKRQTPAKPPAKPVAAPTPVPTFDTLIPAGTYRVYVEVRGTGQLIQSSAVNELLKPILKLAGPPKEFRSFIKFLRAHADEVMTSRLLVATWPGAKQVSDAVVAVEFASAEEASKFATLLKEFLPTVLPTPEPEKPAQSDGNKTATPDKSKPVEPPAPPFHLQRIGSLILITPRPVTLKELRPAGSKLLAEDTNFRTARNRFNSEQLFAFIDIKSVEREEGERRKQYEQTEKEEVEKLKREQAAAQEESKKADEPEEEVTPEEEKAAPQLEATVGLQSTIVVNEPPPPTPLSSALAALGSALFKGQSDWPDAVGLALSLENESFDLRALLMNDPGEKSDAVPFVPMLITGPAYVPEAANILPADSDLFATMSLDFSQIYAELSKPVPPSEFVVSRGNVKTVKITEHEPPFAAIERQLGIKIKEEVLSLLGSEVALVLPLENMNILGLPQPASASSEPKEDATSQPQATSNSPAVAISLRDKDAMRALLPKLIEGLGFKGVSALAQTERREDTELVSFANSFSYAFVGNFLILSAEPTTTRHIVDSYLKHETLATEPQFRSYTRWQPRPLHGQLYISPALMESYKTWAENPTTRISDQTRSFLTRLSTMGQPITYSLSNEGMGPLHELHLPKNLVLMAAAGISGEMNPPPMLQNERMAIGVLYSIAAAQQQYKKDKGAGSLGTLEQLIETQMVSKEMMENSGYRFDLTVSGDKFEITATPIEYGKTGTMSYFMDQTFALRGADHNGASASSADPPIQ